MAIFAAAKIPIAVMGGCLEFAKIILSTWLKINWKTTPIVLRTYFVSSIIVLMMITSAGIFGFLSKAHLDQGIDFNDNNLKIQEIDRKIAIEQQSIKDATLVIAQLDQAVQSLIDANRIRGQNGSIAVRKSQTQERDTLTETIRSANVAITSLQEQKLPLQKQQIALEAEVGPIKYVASLFYDSTDKEMLEKAVIVLILMFIFTFDPLAILMFVAVANTRKKKETKELPIPEAVQVAIEPVVQAVPVTTNEVKPSKNPNKMMSIRSDDIKVSDSVKLEKA